MLEQSEDSFQTSSEALDDLFDNDSYCLREFTPFSQKFQSAQVCCNRHQKINLQTLKISSLITESIAVVSNLMEVATCVKIELNRKKLRQRRNI